MKRLLYLFLLLGMLIISPAFADDTDLPASGDLWDSWSQSQDFYGQDKPAVSDEDFDKAIQSIKDKQNKFGNWKKKKQIPKGEEFHQGNETEVINEQTEEKEALSVICIPVELKVGNDGILPVGHYQVDGEKDENDSIVLKFYQAQYLMAQFPAEETTDDFDEDTISFVKWLPEGDDKIKIIYGSMDFNAYTIIELNE